MNGPSADSPVQAVPVRRSSTRNVHWPVVESGITEHHEVGVHEARREQVSRAGKGGPPRQCERSARNRHLHEAPDGWIDHDRETRDVVGLRRGRIDETAADLEGEGQTDPLATFGGLADDRLDDRQAEYVVRHIQAAAAHVALPVLGSLSLAGPDAVRQLSSAATGLRRHTKCGSPDRVLLYDCGPGWWVVLVPVDVYGMAGWCLVEVLHSWLLVGWLAGIVDQSPTPDQTPQVPETGRGFQALIPIGGSRWVDHLHVVKAVIAGLSE